MLQEVRGQGQEWRGVCPKAVMFPSAWGMPREWPDPSRLGSRTSRNKQNGLGIFLNFQACIPQPQGRARRSLSGHQGLQRRGLVGAAPRAPHHTPC